MVTETLLCRVEDASDIDAMAYRFPKPYEKYILVHWYRDTTWSSDSFGCNTLPNIFHLWILDETQLSGQVGTAVPHINLTGNECNPHVLYRGVQFFWRNGLKLLLSGYIYGGRYPKFIHIYDISDPTKPKLIKELTDGSTTTGSYWNYNVALYYYPEDEIWFGDINGNIYYAKYDTFLTLSKFQDATKLISDSLDSGQTSIDWLGGTTLLARVRNVSTDTVKFYKIDASTKTYTDVSASLQGYCYLPFSGTRFFIGHKCDTGTVTQIDLYTKPDLTLYKSFAVNISSSELFYITDLYDYVVILDNNRLIFLNINDGSITEVAYTRPLKYPGLWTPNVYGFYWLGGLNTSGELYKLTLDYYYYVTYDPVTKKATIKDQAGNPLANATVYIAEETNHAHHTAGEVTALTTDANGVIDLSNYSGKTLRIVKITT